jgi:DNA polymerase/3'-5' exonuclease PolX
MKIRTNTIETPETATTEDITADDNAFLDRDTYRKIKKMDRESMQSFLADIYESGRQKEREEAALAASDASEPTSEDAEEVDDTPKLDMRVLEQQIKSIKGVGEKRAEEIMVVIEKWMFGE